MKQNLQIRIDDTTLKLFKEAYVEKYHGGNTSRAIRHLIVSKLRGLADTNDNVRKYLNELDS